MTPALFHRIGVALYGPHYKGKLATAMGVSIRTVQRFADGEYEPDADQVQALRTLLIERHLAVLDLIHEIES